MNFNKYPYTDFHEMNQDFMLKKIGELEKAVEEKGSSIDDSSIGLNKTWSSRKIKNEIDDSKITVDSQLSDTSANPVENRVIKNALDNITIDVATVEKAGIVKPDGTTITIENNGTVHAVQTPATPIATVDVAGKVKPDGTSILIESDGTIHASGGSGASMWSEIIDKPFEDIGSDFKTETVEDVELLKLSDAVSAKITKIGESADYLKQEQISIADASSGTDNGITYTANDNGTYTISGRATDNSSYKLGVVTVQKGTYKISGCPLNGGISSYGVRIGSGDTFGGFLGEDFGNGVILTFNEETTINLHAEVFNGYTANGEAFTPKIEVNSKSNVELTKELSGLYKIEKVVCGYLQATNNVGTIILDNFRPKDGILIRVELDDVNYWCKIYSDTVIGVSNYNYENPDTSRQFYVIAYYLVPMS